MTALTRHVWTHACGCVGEVCTHTNKRRVADSIRMKSAKPFLYHHWNHIRGLPLLGSFPGRTGDPVWLSRPSSPIALPLYELRFHRCSQKHPENAQQSSEWSTYACSIISGDIYIQLFKSPSQVICIRSSDSLSVILRHTTFIWKPACTHEGTFYQKRVCQPGSIQDRPRHPSYLLAADTHRC